MINTHTVEADGFRLAKGIYTKSEAISLRDRLEPVEGAGRRGLLSQDLIAYVANSDTVLSLVRPYLQLQPKAVRAIYFDKSPDSNWVVGWHQDLTIAVKASHNLEGYGPWSTKNDIPHVQPPVDCLQNMVTLRLHLDDADEANGALRVIPGSHKSGRLASSQIQEIRSAEHEYLCSASVGDALLMRPLLLHASGKSTSSRHRRILHIEYAGYELPYPLEWHEAA